MVLASRWLRRFDRGPLEIVMHRACGARLTRSGSAARPAGTGGRTR
ncbi:hypothetical protein ACVGVM_02960 [Pseudonocardia bannensis]